MIALAFILVTAPAGHARGGGGGGHGGGGGGHGGGHGGGGGGHHHHGGGHHHHGHWGDVFIGTGPDWEDSLWWYEPSPFYGYSPAPDLVEEPPVYIQRPVTPPAAFWYYCASARAYYPTAPTCPEPWIKVPPRPG